MATPGVRAGDVEHLRMDRYDSRWDAAAEFWISYGGYVTAAVGAIVFVAILLIAGPSYD